MDKNFKAINEPIIDFEPGSKHRKLLLEEIERQSSRQKDIPVSYTHLTLPTNREV